MSRIGIIGVGLLGGAVVARLLKAGFKVTGYDTRSEQVRALRPQGLHAAHSLAEVAAGADAIFTILPSLESVSNPRTDHSMAYDTTLLPIENVADFSKHIFGSLHNCFTDMDGFRILERATSKAHDWKR